MDVKCRKRSALHASWKIDSICCRRSRRRGSLSARVAAKPRAGEIPVKGYGTRSHAQRSAVSSTLSPPKRRIASTLLLRSSMAARRCNARSAATTSATWSGDKTAAASPDSAPSRPRVSRPSAHGKHISFRDRAAARSGRAQRDRSAPSGKARPKRSGAAAFSNRKMIMKSEGKQVVQRHSFL